MDQVQSVQYVVGVVLPRVRHRLTDLDIGRKVHHSVEPALANDVRDLITVCEISLDQLAVDHRVHVPGREIIKRDRFVARPH